MAFPCSLVFQVNRSKPQLIKPAKQTPFEIKFLSDIDDQGGLRFQVPVVLAYKNNNPSMSSSLNYVDPVHVIRDALSRALVYYYPLAGRLREGLNRKLMVDCNGEGVLFVEATASDVTLEQLGDAIRPPCPLLDKFLCDVPGSDGILGCPLLLIQVTRLRCGGLIFALRLNHTLCDGQGLAQFLKAVGELARGKDSPSILPVWEREVLYARNPPRITCRHYEYEEIIDESNQEPKPTSEMVQQAFYFGPKEVDALKKHLPPQLRNSSSTFDLITACVWKCRTVALEFNPNQLVRLSYIINARGKKNKLRLPLGYYGNAFAYPAVISKAEQLCKSPLSYALELVKKAKAKMNEEYMRSLADLMVTRGRPSYTSIGNYIVSDNRRIGFEEVDFGWGKPEFSGAAKPLGLISFYVQHKKENEEGTLVPVCLPFWSMERFHHEIKRMTSLDTIETTSYNTTFKSML